MTILGSGLDFDAFLDELPPAIQKASADSVEAAREGDCRDEEIIQVMTSVAELFEFVKDDALPSKDDVEAVVWDVLEHEQEDAEVEKALLDVGNAVFDAILEIGSVEVRENIVGWFSELFSKEDGDDEDDDDYDWSDDDIYET